MISLGRLKIGVVFLLLGLAGCASNPREPITQVGSPDLEAQEQQEQDQAAAEEANKDPFEGFNRAIFSFNMTLDRWLLKPVARGYDFVMPGFAKTGVGNFFDNIGEVTNVANDILQWKWKRAGKDTGRFAINTTLGIVGLFDVASKMGIDESEGEDFGQTLAVWGVPQGNYLVLPFLGPSSVRGVGGLVGDIYTSPLIAVNDEEVYWGLLALQTVHDRAELLALEELASGDLYVFLREAYLQRREYLINDGEIADSFGSDFDEEFDEDFDDDWGE